MAQTARDQGRAYVRVANAIRADIAAGHLKAGDKLPSIRDLAATHDVAEVTARNALRLLADEGVAYADTTRGYFVADGASAAEGAAPSPEYLAVTEQLDALSEDLERINDRLAKIEQVIHLDSQPAEKTARRGRRPADQDTK